MAVRRLPVVQNSEEDPRRPAWQWVLIGGGFAMTIWLPLLGLVFWLAPWVSSFWLNLETPAVTMALLLLAFGLASLLAGLWVRRFGKVELRHAALGPLLGALALACIGWVVGEIQLLPALVAAASLGLVGAVAGALGGYAARR